ncbi:unnamed protein product [Soboliphyme baturini]|uniref:Equilibrative nucleoside transporter 3 n=1 Tax=Soboliphyme baturini TaxID=241478 RepID=A0A183J8G6_9BILA|nr:unnamed protein product [Soboliphyme baturini]
MAEYPGQDSKPRLLEYHSITQEMESNNNAATPNTFTLESEALLNNEKKGAGMKYDVGIKDRFNLVYLCFLLHGVGMLLPWNLFITAEAYFTKHKLAGSGYDKEFLWYVAVCSQTPNLLFNIINIFSKKGSGLRKKVLACLMTMALIYVGTTVLAMVDSSQWPGVFFALTMISVLVLNSATGMYQNCIYGLAADFPSSYSNAVLVGNNFSGLLTSTLYIITIAGRCSVDRFGSVTGVV